MVNDLNVVFLVPSRNRACQLHALMESVRINFDNPPGFHIIYSISSPEFDAGYKKLQDMNMFPSIVWHRERDLYGDFLDKINEEDWSEFVCLCSDDSLFYRKVDLRPKDLDYIFDAETICFNFRLGLNTLVQDYLNGSRQPPLTDYTTSPDNRFIKWNYKRYSDVHNYGYPFSFDGHVYRTEDLNRYTRTLALDAGKIRHWEGRMCGGQHRHVLDKSSMQCYQHSVLFNNPVNCVQDPPLYHSNNVHIPPEALNTMFLEGKVIDVEKLRELDISGSHQEWGYVFK